jgi:hypothetical protein
MKKPHIIAVSLSDLPSDEGSVLSSIGGSTTVIVSFGDGSVYRYPRIPTSLALAFQSDPEGTFQNIKFWPGYARIR